MEIIVWSLGLLVLIFCFAVFFGAPYVPTRQVDVEEIFNNLVISKKTRFVDLGSGDGKLVLFAAKKGINATGYEINPILWAISSYRLRNYKNANIKYSNMWSADISSADVVFVFLATKYMSKLERKLNAEMSQDSILVSYVFKLHQKKQYRKTNNAFYYKF